MARCTSLMCAWVKPSASGDNTRIIVGSPELWVRFFIESFWMDRIALGSRYKIYHSETNEYLGSGQVMYRAPYMGRRDFRTEDVQERFDTKFQEVVLSFTPEKDRHSHRTVRGCGTGGRYPLGFSLLQ